MSTTKKKAVASKRSLPSRNNNLDDMMNEALSALIPSFGTGDKVYILDKRAKRITECVVARIATIHTPETLPERSETVIVSHYYDLNWKGGFIETVPEKDIIPTFKEASYQLGLICVE